MLKGKSIHNITFCIKYHNMCNKHIRPLHMNALDGFSNHIVNASLLWSPPSAVWIDASANEVLYPYQSWVQHYLISKIERCTIFHLHVSFQGKIIRPNIECTNGIIHLVDTVMMDDQLEWAPVSSGGDRVYLGGDRVYLGGVLSLPLLLTFYLL